MTHFRVTVPVTYKDSDGKEQTSFRNVGTMFENKRKETGEIFYAIKLDFPVGVQELVAFAPKSKEDDA